MDYLRAYRHIEARDLAELCNGAIWINGHFRVEERLVEGIQYLKPYRSALEWFVNSPFATAEEVMAFTRKCGVLRWNWTHQGYGGGKSDQFSIPVKGFLESQQELRENWKQAQNPTTRNQAIKWLCNQLGPEPDAEEVQKPEDMWKLSKPSTRFIPAETKKANVDVIVIWLSFGDLWQAFCHSLLDKLMEGRGQVLVCKNQYCDNLQYFIGTGNQKRFCSPECGKRATDRHSARKRRVKANQRARPS